MGYKHSFGFIDLSRYLDYALIISFLSDKYHLKSYFDFALVAKEQISFSWFLSWIVGSFQSLVGGDLRLKKNRP